MKRNTVIPEPTNLFFFSLFIVLLFSFTANSQPNLQDLKPTFWQGSGGSEPGYPCLMDDETTFRMEALQSLIYANPTLPDTGQVDYRDYDIKVRLFPNRHFLEGDVQVIFRSKVAQLSLVDFWLYNDTLQIKSVTHGIDTLNYSYTDSVQMLRVWLSDTLGLSQEDTLRIVYSGYITPDLSRRMGYGCQLDSTVSFSLNPQIWYPVPYDSRAPYRVLLWASGRVRMTVPRAWRVVSTGGLLDSLVTDSTQAYTWGTTSPVGRFYYVAGPYLMHTRPYAGITLRYYDTDTTGADAQLAIARRALDFYSRAFCPYRFEKLAFADPLRGQAFGGSVYSLNIMGLPGLETGIAHETSHQWWAFLVRHRSYEETWLSEAFATYSEALYLEDTLGRASRDARIDTFADGYLRRVPRNEDKPIIPTPYSYGGWMLIVYWKGAWVLHMLRGVVGDSTFFNVMRTYATTYKDSSTTVAMYRNVAEQVSGRNLGWFFDEWLYHTGAPSYTYSWQSRQIGVDTFQLTLWVNQLDSLFTMPIQTSIFTQSGRQDQWPVVAHRSDTFQFLLSQNPDSVILDKDDWLLDRGITRVGVEAGTPSLPLTTTLLPVHPNPFRGSARIDYSLAAKGRVRLSVYNVAGQLVRELVNEPQAPGRYSASWDRRNESGRSVPAGVYFIRFETSAYRVTEKAVLLR